MNLFGNVPAVYPCFSFPTLGGSLDSAGVSWKYFTGERPLDFWDGLVDAFRAIDPVWNSGTYARHVEPRANFFDEVTSSQGACTLPGVSWITPNGNASDHAGFDNNADGQYWIAELYESIAQSPCYADTAFLVIWDDSGGWFDSVPPPYVKPAAPYPAGYRDTVVGMRVPLLFVAPDAVRGTSGKPRDFGAVLAFVERNFGLPSLTGSEDTDFGGDALADMWMPHPAATIAPIPRSQVFVGERKRYSQQWFRMQRPAPADDR